MPQRPGGRRAVPGRSQPGAAPLLESCVMSLVALSGVEKAYGEQVVLRDANLEVRAGQRLALIGRNGAGKSTVLRLLMGLEEPDAGQVLRARDVVVGMLDQDPEFGPEDTVRSVADEAFAELDALDAQLRALEAAGLDDPARFEEWERLHAVFERRGGYSRRARRDAVLAALGFADRHDDRVRDLSGGERTRLGLARLLMAQPDVLLLDEPTNHLDMDMRAWLEGHLARYPGAAVVVSHDRAFLDAACDTTAEVSRGELRLGPGNPSAYRAARAEAERVQAATRANQERESARLHAAAEQMKRWAGQNAKLHRRAKAMERRAERFDAQMVDEVARPERTTRFAFDCDESGDVVLTARHLTQRFDRTLFEDVTVELRRGDRVALVGPNGAGKTTFLRTLLGELPSLDPRASVTTGARVRLGYYDQHLRGVDDDATLFEELLRRMGDREAHDALGRFMFPYEAQFKRVRDLSGGERARLALLLLTLGRYNLLVLDEPTNHLDVEMIEALEDALRAYTGTLLVVSHDRRFLSGLVNRVWEVQDGRFREYEGDWEFYWRKRRGRAELDAAQAAVGTDAAAPAAGAVRDAAGPSRAAATRAPTSGRFAGRSPWRLRRDLEEVEARIASLEAELGRVAAALSTPGPEAVALVPELASRPGPPPSDAEVIAALGRLHAELEGRLLELMEEWHELTDLVGA